MAPAGKNQKFSPRDLQSREPVPIISLLARQPRPTRQVAHSSRGLGRRPLTPVTRVRIPYALPIFPPSASHVSLASSASPQLVPTSRCPLPTTRPSVEHFRMENRCMGNRCMGNRCMGNRCMVKNLGHAQTCSLRNRLRAEYENPVRRSSAGRGFLCPWLRTPDR